MSVAEWKSSALLPLIATFSVSIVPAALLFLIPAPKDAAKESRNRKNASMDWKGLFLNVLMCFSAGSLISDALIHILLHGILHGGPSERAAERQVMATLVGVASFLTLDLFTRAAVDNVGHGHHHHSHEPRKGTDRASSKLRKVSRDKGRPSPGSAGLLNLLADAIHNFTDGLTIAAAFSRDFKLGLSTTLAIFLHEIPHELGDYAMLIKAGHSHLRAVLLQLLTGVAALLGCASGMFLQSQWLSKFFSFDQGLLLPFVAGGFLYVAFCSILPEVLADRQFHRGLYPIIYVGSFVFGIYFLSVVEI